MLKEVLKFVRRVRLFDQVISNSIFLSVCVHAQANYKVFEQLPVFDGDDLIACAMAEVNRHFFV